MAVETRRARGAARGAGSQPPSPSEVVAPPRARSDAPRVRVHQPRCGHGRMLRAAHRHCLASVARGTIVFVQGVVCEKP